MQPLNINVFTKRGERPSAVRRIPAELKTRIEKYDKDGKVLEIQEMTTRKASERSSRERGSKSLDKIAAMQTMVIKKVEIKKG